MLSWDANSIRPSSHQFHLAHTTAAQIQHKKMLYQQCLAQWRSHRLETHSAGSRVKITTLNLLGEAC